MGKFNNWGIVFLFPLLFAACSAANANPLLASADAQATLQAGRLIAEYTQAAREDRILSATLQAADLQRTVDHQIKLTAGAIEATSAAFTATQQAHSAALTETTSAQQLQRTQTAESAALQRTQAAASLANTQAAGDLQATNDIRQFEAEQRTLQLQRQRFINYAQALAGYVVGGVILFLAFRLVWQRSRVRVIRREHSGDAPVLLVDGFIVDADLAAGPVTNMSKAPRALPPGSPEQQAIKAADQKVNAIRALPADKKEDAIGNFSAGEHKPQIEIIESDDIAPWLEEVTKKLADHLED